MTELISGLARLVVRLVLVAAGLVFAAALLVALLLFVAFWTVRAAWARLTGRPVTPFVMRMDPRTGFGHVFRAGQGMQRGPMQDDTMQDFGVQDFGVREPGAPVPRREIADVTDVVAKEPRSEDPRQP